MVLMDQPADQRLAAPQMEGDCLALRDLTGPRSSPGAEDRGAGGGGPSDHKENLFTERTRSAPLKPDAAALLAGRRAADLAQLTPVKRGAPAEPWTPTANLKMLISAASPDIRDREMKKVLFRPTENHRDQAARPDGGVQEAGAGDPPQQEDQDQDQDQDVEKKPSRKQKSLGLLCQKFLALYPDHAPPHGPVRISLDEVATHLGVERRRIYDIVNVLESLMIVGRIAKNSYTWYGRRRLRATLQELQRRALQQGYHLQVAPDGEVGGATAGPDDEGPEGDAGNAGSSRKDKSLRIMSQKFVMLFLVSRTHTVTLDAAAKLLIEEGRDASSHSKYKTKVRRLYDIANVLTSLGLISKVHVREQRGRKPAFRWLGPVQFSGAGDALNAAAITPPGSAAVQDVRIETAGAAAAGGPRRELMGPANQPVDYSRKTLAAAAETPPSTALQPPAPHLAPPPSAHCLAYLPSLSQPSVVMLYRPPGLEEEGRKRRGGEEEEEVKRRRGGPRLEERLQARVRPDGEAAHYLYLPHSPGLDGLNLLLAGAPPAGGAALALPCVLVAPPSHYPLLGGGSDAGLGFGVMSPRHFLLGASPYGAAGDLSPGSAPASPEQRRAYGPPDTPGPPTPHTPKEAAAAAASFFRTPGALGGGVSAAPAPRRRASAQRRLDVGHAPNRPDVSPK